MAAEKVSHTRLRNRYLIGSCSIGISSVPAMSASHRWLQYRHLIGGCSIGIASVAAASASHRRLRYGYLTGGGSIGPCLARQVEVGFASHPGPQISRSGGWPKCSMLGCSARSLFRPLPGAAVEPGSGPIEVKKRPRNQIPKNVALYCF